MQVQRTANKAVSQQFQFHQIAAVIVSFLPLIFTLATWDNVGRQAGIQFAIRHLSIPVIIGEIIIIMLAVYKGFEIRLLFADVSKVTKALLVAWAFFAILSLSRSETQLQLSIFTTVRYMIHALFFVALISIYQQSQKFDSNKCLALFALGGITYVGALTLFAIMVPDKETFPWVLRMPTGTNIRQIGYYVAITGVAPLALLLFAKHRIFFAAISFMATVMFVSWTGSRGALLGLMIGSIAALLLARHKPSIKRVCLAFAFFVTGIGSSILLPTPGPEFGLIRMMESGKAEDKTSGRMQIWSDSIQEIIDRPLVGHGSGTFNRNMKAKYDIDFNHPHQFVLQYAYDWGVIGASAALLLLAKLLWSIWRIARARNDASGFAAMGSFLVIVSVALIDGALFYPLSIVAALAMIALGIGMPNDEKETLAGSPTG